MPLEHLFAAVLQYRQGVAPVVPTEGREGELIGSGDGVADGDKLAGRLRWSMFAADCPFHPDGGERVNNGDHVCTTNPALILETRDGATIWFDAKGFGLRRENAEPTWVLTASLRFHTDDARYSWLNQAPGVWEGVFDEEAQHARYHAFVQTTEGDGSS